MSTELVCAVVALCAFPVLIGAAAADGTASGWLEVKGQRVELKYAFAAASEDALEDGDKEKIEVLLSDKPVPPELQKATDAWSFWAAEQAQKGQMHGIMVYINPQTKSWSRGQRLSKYGMEFYSQSSSSPESSNLVFTPAAAGSGEIAGKVTMKQPMRAVDENEGPWRVDAEFRTAVIPRPAVTATFSAAEARNSAPYKAVQAHLQACQKRDLEAIKKTLTKNSLALLARFEAERGRKAILDMMFEQAADAQKMKVSKVVVRGESAEVVFGESAKDPNGQQTMRVVLEDGTWKMGQ